MSNLTLKTPPSVFTLEDSRLAFEAWGANCGPNALAQCVGYRLDQVRSFLGDFEQKGFMTPSMMKASIKRLARLNEMPPLLHGWPLYGIVRIQWTGPWTAPDANPRWAYQYTHWVHSYVRDGVVWIFDANGGWYDVGEWQEKVVKAITKEIKRADGGYIRTHTWGVGGFPPGSKWRAGK